MNKTMMFLGLLAIGLVNAQQGRVGVNTEAPKATLDVKERLGSNGLPVDAHLQGVSFPNFTTTQREKLGEGITQSMKEGTLIYNTTKKCIEMYRGYINNVHTWECLNFGNNNGGSGSGSNDGGSTGGGSSTASTQSPITGNVTLAGKTHYIASIKDTEYIPFEKPIQPATWEIGETNGDDPLINVAGIITTQGIDIEIPIKVTGNGGTVGAYRQEVPVTAEKSQNNQAGTLILEWNPQTVTTSNAFITAKLKAKNTDFHIKQLDLAKGLGNDYRGLVLANFTYKKDNTNSATETFTVRAISGIPDKKFGVKTNNKLEHQFIYLPIQGPDGRVWLNNNLGAEYARVDSPYFNPARQAGALDYTNTTTGAREIANPTDEQIRNDWRAYGYMYHLGFHSDYEEIIRWTSRTSGRSVSTTRMGNNVYGGCPDGFHVPGAEDVENPPLEVSDAIKTLKLTAGTGMRERSGFGFRTNRCIVSSRTSWTDDNLPGDDYDEYHIVYCANTQNGKMEISYVRTIEQDYNYPYPMRCIKDQ